MADAISDVRQEIGAGRLATACLGLISYVQRESPDRVDTLIGLQSQFNRAEDQRGKQLLSFEEYSLAINNVTYSLLRICTDLERTHGQRVSPQQAVGTTVTAPVVVSQNDDLRLGIESWQRNDYTQAVTALEAVLAQDPNSYEALLYLGIIREEIGDIEGAMDFYNRSLQIKPDHAIALNNRGVLLLNAEQYGAAIQDFAAAIAADPTLSIAYFNRAIALSNLGEYPAALDALNDCARRGINLGQVFYYRSLVRTHLQDYTGASEDAQRGLQLEPSNTEHRYAWALALFNAGHYRETIGHLNAVLEAEPQHYDSTKIRGMCYCLIDEYAAAQADIDRFLTAEPENADAHYWRGYILQNTGQPVEAINAFNAALECDPHHKATYVNRGVIMLQHDLPEQALGDFRLAKQLDPDWEILPGLIQQAEEALRQSAGLWGGIKKLFS